MPSTTKLLLERRRFPSSGPFPSIADGRGSSRSKLLLCCLCLFSCLSFLAQREFFLIYSKSRRAPSGNDIGSPPLKLLEPRTRRNGDDDGSKAFLHLQHPHDVDADAVERALDRNVRNDDPGKCDNILLYLPGELAIHGIGSQLNTYLLASMMATFMDRALVILDPPHDERFPGNSAFGCPPESVIESEGGENATLVADGFHHGIERLIVHPEWLSRGCSIPCSDTHTFKDWDDIYNSYRDGKRQGFDWNEKVFKGYTTKHREPVVCERDGRKVSVLTLGGKPMRNYFTHELKKSMTIERDEEHNTQWALRFGATEAESRHFGKLESEKEVWDHVSMWVTRTGLVKFRPWISRDVSSIINSMPIDPVEPYDAIHVRRGDKIMMEAKSLIKEWYESRRMEYRHGKFIPFSHYLVQFGKGNGEDIDDCKEDADRIYVATNGQNVVRDEILGLEPAGETHVDVGRCNNTKLEFSFYPEATKAVHVKNAKTCEDKYEVNLAAIAELALLVRSSRFVGEYNSNWGRLVRTLRTGYDRELDVPKTKDVRVAWGPEMPEPPGY